MYVTNAGCPGLKSDRSDGAICYDDWPESMEDTMPSLKEHRADAAIEAAFRRGFSHGVEAAVHAVEARLTEADQRKLRKWAEAVLEWRGPLGSEEFAAPSAPDFET
jgi:hypothetical protein